jgi:UDP-N-acetylglucosamine--N-acetylmuramyl-(pentapeptide) pyrophosphoryl-undecaprenol N-acetylglucosamine transferase
MATQTQQSIQPVIKVLLMAGGTGGHVFPALAVADELRHRGIQVAWLGTQKGIEADVVPKAGIDISFIDVAGLRGKGLLGWLLAPFKLMHALWQALSVLRRINPVVVLGMGGFVTGPGGIAAWLLRCPLVIHEQNAIAGLTNKLLTPFTVRVLEAFPGTIKSRKTVHTGNPVRNAIGVEKGVERNVEKVAEQKQASPGESVEKKIHLLVVGGSLGAKALNEVVPEALAQLSEPQRPEVWHQSGKKNINETLALYKTHGIEAKVEPFIDDMGAAYGWADLVLCRAGALTIAELAIAGMPSILVPYPYAVDDHQTSNAKYLAENGAAFLVQQKDLTASRLIDLLNELDIAKLHKMAAAAKKLALPDATKKVADLCLEVARV